MKSLVLFIGACFLSIMCFSQINDIVDKSVVVYTNFSFDTKEYQIPVDINRTVIMNRAANLVQPSIALRTTRANGWSRELEFNNLSLLRVDDLREVTRPDTLNSFLIQTVDGYKRISSS